MGPNTASNPALPCTESAIRAREAAVGNDDRYVDSVAAIVAPKTSPTARRRDRHAWRW